MAAQCRPPANGVVQLAITCCLIALTTYPQRSSAQDDQRVFSMAAAYFQTACLASLSEESFRTLPRKYGAKESDTTGMPFSIAYGLPGYMGATYYKAPRKCCISIMDVSLNSAASQLPKYLSLRNPKSLVVEGRNMVVFRPEFEDRLVSMDWNKSSTTGHSVANICHTVYPGAMSYYKTLSH